MFTFVITVHISRMEKTEVKKETVKKSGGIENAFSKTKKASDEPVKSASVGVVKVISSDLQPSIESSCLESVY